MEADIAAKAVELGTNTDFSLFSLFFRADIIVKSVMIILILCSVYSWAVIIDKFRLFKKINKSSEEFEEKFWNSKSAENFYNNLPTKVEDPMALVFQSAMDGLLKKKSKTNLSERMTAMLESGVEKQMTKQVKDRCLLAGAIRILLLTTHASRVDLVFTNESLWSLCFAWCIWFLHAC